MDKVLKKETIYLYIVLGANFLLPLITIPYLTKVLGLSGFGLFGYSQTIFLLFTLAITPLPGIILNSSGILISLLYVSWNNVYVPIPAS